MQNYLNEALTVTYKHIVDTSKYAHANAGKVPSLQPMGNNINFKIVSV